MKTQLEPRGQEFFDDTTANYELNAGELLLLRELCRTIDTLDKLDAAIRRDGAMTTGAAGHDVVHPATTEARGQRIVLHRLLAALKLPDIEGNAIPSGYSISASNAADARWHRSSSPARKAR